MLARLTMFAFAASLSLPATVLAQARIGVMGGLSFATIGGDDVEDASTRTGPIFGVSFVKPLGGALGLEVDGLYSARGFKATTEGVSGGLKTTYIEVPLLLRYSFSEGSTKPHLGAGVSLGFQTGCKFEIGEGSVSAEVSCSMLEDEADVGVEFEKFDAQLVLGGGVDFVRGKNTITLGARYNYGLTDVVSDASWRNRGFSIFAGFSMPVGK